MGTVVRRRVVQVVARRAQEDTPEAGNIAVPTPPTNSRRPGDQLDRCRQLFGEQPRRGQPVLAPPTIDRTDLQLRVGDDDNFHQRRRRSLRTSAAARPSPAWACRHALTSASSRSPRSAASRSSPSSSTTRSSTVPSGREVGSSTTSRPFFTRARTPLMGRMLPDRCRGASDQHFSLGPDTSPRSRPHRVSLPIGSAPRDRRKTHQVRSRGPAERYAARPWFARSEE